jgi:hypothetical protein
LDFTTSRISGVISLMRFMAMAASASSSEDDGVVRKRHPVANPTDVSTTRDPARNLGLRSNIAANAPFRGNRAGTIDGFNVVGEAPAHPLIR